MGEFGYQRVQSTLSWEHERGRLLAAYREVLLEPSMQMASESGSAIEAP